MRSSSEEAGTQVLPSLDILYSEFVAKSYPDNVIFIRKTAK